MTGRRRVLVVGPDSDRAAGLADGIRAGAVPASVEEFVDSADGPGLDALVLDGVDCVVWTGPLGRADLEALVDRAADADAAVVLVGDDGGYPPAAAFEAGVDEYVHAGEGAPTVLARRVAALLDDDAVAGGGSASGGERVGDGGRVTSDADDAAERGADAGAGNPQVGDHADRVLDRMDEGVIGLDENLDVTYANAEVESILGRSADEFVGDDVWEVFPDAEGTVFEDEYRAALESQEPRTFEAYVEGLDAWLETTVYPAPDGLSVYVRDVTEQRHTKAELERNERALRDLQRLASARDLTLSEKLDRALAVGCERLDLPLGFVTRIDDDDGTQTILASHGDPRPDAEGDEGDGDAGSGDEGSEGAGSTAERRTDAGSTAERRTDAGSVDAGGENGDSAGETGGDGAARDQFEPGSTAPLSEAYCRRTIEGEGLLAVERASEEGWDDDPAYERFGLECYLGGKLLVDGDLYGTVCFGSGERRERTVSAAERTFIELLVEWVSYELERRERERDLERYETILRSVDDGVYELDAEGTFTYVNPALAALTGYDVEDLVGEHVSVVRDDDETETALSALLAGEAAERTVEGTVRRRRGEPVPTEDSMTALVGADDEVRGVVGVVRDVTEQKARREMLSDLLASSRSLMQARDREEVADVVARAVKNVLGFELNVVRLYDSGTDRLVPAGTTEDVTDRLQDPPTYDIDEGGPGRAFVDGETVVIENTRDLDDDYERRVVRSAMHVPMGVHGTISIGAEEPGAFSDVDRRAAQLMATSAAAAANRAKREREVRDARERVDTLVDRINGLIEDTVEVLVQAGTREELERGVVEQLVATDPYAFAWIGRPDLTDETLEVAAWDGDVPALADAVADLELDRAAAREAADPAALALDDETIHIVGDLAEMDDECVHTRAHEAGLGSMIAVPLTYKEASYGVLCVYAVEPDAFAEREQVVLDALGRAVANAVNAIEIGRILSTDRVVELEFTVRDAALLFGRLSARTEATLELTGSVYESDGRLRLYVTASGADVADLREFLADDEGVAAFGVIADHDDEVLFEATVDDSLVALLADHGAVTRTVTAEDGLVRYTIELPYEAEAREVFELVEDRYENTDLVGYHEHERPVRTRQEFREAVLDRFTDRQETAVRTAYLGGFFEWPRDVDGDDLAESMDISRPTYHQHLRAAQRKVFDELFDPHSGRRD